MSEITRNQAIQIVEDIRTAISAGSVTNTMEAQVLEYCVKVLGGRIEEASQSGDLVNLADIVPFLAGISSSETLKNLLTAISTSIADRYAYAGIASPSSTPISGKVLYIAVQAGTYTNFGNTVVTEGINILKYNGEAWVKENVIGIDNKPTLLSNNLVKSGGVYEEIEKVHSKIIQGSSVWSKNSDNAIQVNGNITSSNQYDVYLINNNGYNRIYGIASSYINLPIVAFYNGTPSSSTLISTVITDKNKEDKAFYANIPDGTTVIAVNGYHEASVPSVDLITNIDIVESLEGIKNDIVFKNSQKKPKDVEIKDELIRGSEDLVENGVVYAELYEQKDLLPDSVTIAKTAIKPDGSLKGNTIGYTCFKIANHDFGKIYGEASTYAEFIKVAFYSSDTPSSSSYISGSSQSRVLSRQLEPYNLIVPANCVTILVCQADETVATCYEKAEKYLRGADIEDIMGDVEELNATKDDLIAENQGKYNIKQKFKDALEDALELGHIPADYYLKGHTKVDFSSARKLCVIAAGQSNIEGRNSYSDLPSDVVNPNNKVRFCDNTDGIFSDFEITDGGSNNDWGFDTIIYNALTQAAYGNQSEIYVMKKAKGGTSLDKDGATLYHWTADYEYLDRESHSLLRSFEKIIRKGVTTQGSNFDIKAFLWCQGEGDAANLTAAQNYYTNLKNMFAYVRGVVGNPRLHIFCCNIPNASVDPYNDIINEAYSRLASEDFYLHVVDMRNAQLEDSWHYEYHWSIYLGQKIYDLMIDYGLITGTKINPVEPGVFL